MNRQNCVYRDTSNRIEDLEETQTRLEERLLELEGPSSSVILTDPFASSSKLSFVFASSLANASSATPAEEVSNPQTILLYRLKREHTY